MKLTGAWIEKVMGWLRAASERNVGVEDVALVHPRRELTPEDLKRTLQGLGLWPSATLKLRGDAPPPPPPPQIVHEEDCDDTLTRPLLLEELARYRDVALKLDADVHVEIEYDTQEGDFEQGDTTERHITNTVVLRMDARARAPAAATDGEAEAEAAPADPGKEEL